ncbi:MAG TPA: alkene reductase [Polyangia bacterium]|jgi:N-ethylmaleimide reductase|nr:alkene reductase [Polyangia bacterium]
MKAENPLLSPVKLGPYELPNRLVMAPMTRLRAVGGTPTPLMATYYSQRASAGLIVTECTMVSPMSLGYINCPGIYSPEQLAGWREVTQAVHAQGGRIFLQLWHCGRVSHTALLGGKAPVAPSAIAGEGLLHTPEGKAPMSVPRALETEEIPGIVAEFSQGAEQARAAGFDGVELHGAYGYLIEQFLWDGSNQRTDRYGGSVENRARFVLEVVKAVVDVWGGPRVGIKLSPSNTSYGMRDSNPRATYGYLLPQLSRFGLAYVHAMEPLEPGGFGIINPVAPWVRPLYQGTLITNGAYDPAKAQSVLREGQADLVSFGRLFLANPDLPRRIAVNAAMNPPDFATLYGHGAAGLEKGYTDYPALA